MIIKRNIYGGDIIGTRTQFEFQKYEKKKTMIHDSKDGN